jgi:pilus assembly protein CpaD
MSSSDRATIREHGFPRARLWSAGLALLALGACAGGHDGKAALDPPVTPSERYSIEVKPDPMELKLAAHAGGLSAAQVDALRDFVARWNDTERGPITIKAPEHGPDRAGVYRTASDTRDFLVSAGVPATDVRLVGYDAAGDDRAPLLVGFLRYQAKGPHCGQSWSDLSHTDANDGYPEFGCAVTANIAAQLAYPADLLHPEAASPPDADRRDMVLGKYRQGQTTSSAVDPQAQTSLSSVGNQ